ncbi:MAG: PAAR domain-containing protein [Polyangia bacterium]
MVPADVHSCPGCPHPACMGPAISGSGNVLINGLPALREGDQGIHTACCGPNTWTVLEASGQVFVNGQRLVRQGDRTLHCGGIGMMIEASGDVHDNSRKASLIAEQLLKILTAVLARQEVLFQNLSRGLVESYGDDPDFDDLQSMMDALERLKGASPGDVEVINRLISDGTLAPDHMLKGDVEWVHDKQGHLVGFYEHRDGMHWAYGLDGKRHLLGEDGATSPGDLTDAILLLSGTGIASKLGRGALERAGVRLGAAEAGGEGAASLGSRAKDVLRRQGQKAKDAIPRSWSDARARAYNKAVEIGSKPPGDGRPGPMPGAPPPETYKDALKEVGKELAKQGFQAARKHLGL